MGEKVADWDGKGKEPEVAEDARDEEPQSYPEPEDGESATEYNKRLLAWYQRGGYPFKTVGEMHATMGTQKLFKELTSTKGVRGISAPRSSSSVPR